MGLNSPKLPEAPRREYDRKRGGAMYGMQPTIAKAMCGKEKGAKIVQATWNYQPGRTTLIKGDRHVTA